MRPLLILSILAGLLVVGACAPPEVDAQLFGRFRSQGVVYSGHCMPHHMYSNGAAVTYPQMFAIAYRINKLEVLHDMAESQRGIRSELGKMNENMVDGFAGITEALTNQTEAAILQSYIEQKKADNNGGAQPTAYMLPAPSSAMVQPTGSVLRSISYPHMRTFQRLYLR